jgi:hypothetical protein
MKWIIHPRKEHQQVQRRNLWLKMEKHLKNAKRLMMIYTRLPKNLRKSSHIHLGVEKDVVNLSGYICLTVVCDDYILYAYCESIFHFHFDSGQGSVG